MGEVEFQHTDEDGDRVRLIRMGHVEFRLVMDSSNADTSTVVDLPESVLFRLGDIIEEIRTR